VAVLFRHNNIVFIR